MVKAESTEAVWDDLQMHCLDTGAISPMLKELFNFADVDAEQVTDKIAEYLADLVNRPN